MLRPLLFTLLFACVAVTSTADASLRASPAAAQEATSLHYVAIGDSVTGTGSAAPNGWVNGYARVIGATRITNLAQNGWTSSQILFALRYDAAFRSSVRSARLVTLNAGMNEFFTARDAYSRNACGGPDNEDCARDAVLRFAANWRAIMTEIRALAPDAAIVALNLYHPLEVFDAHFGWADAMNRLIRAMNAEVAASGLPVADIFTAYNGPAGLDDPIAKGYILPDAIHATDLGHAVIVDVLRRLNYAPPVRTSVLAGTGEPHNDPIACTVETVIDGASFACRDGTRVRLMHLGSPAPCGADWARAALAMFLPPGRQVGLEYDTARRDAAGRAVAAPIVIGSDGHAYNMTIVMVYVGLARAVDDGNGKFLGLTRASETWARGAYWNMWAPGQPLSSGC